MYACLIRLVTTNCSAHLRLVHNICSSRKKSFASSETETNEVAQQTPVSIVRQIPENETDESQHWHSSIPKQSPYNVNPSESIGADDNNNPCGGAKTTSPIRPQPTPIGSAVSSFTFSI